MKHRITAAIAALVLTAVSLLYAAPANASRLPPRATAADRPTIGVHAPKGKPPAAPGRSVHHTKFGPQSVTYFYGEARQTIAASPVKLGATVNLTVQKPYVAAADYHSLAELAVMSSDRQQIVEIGWNVDPAVNGDSLPHLFVSHWVNGVGTCYNGCGWVDYAPNAVNAGSSLASYIGVSKQFGAEYYNNAWWLFFGGAYIGYFPVSLWSGASPPATFTQVRQVQGFGEVAASSTTPCTDMGNGLLGTSANTTAARVGSLTNADSSYTYTSAVYDAGSPFVVPSSASPSRYSVYAVSGSTFRYGGPGYC